MPSFRHPLLAATMIAATIGAAPFAFAQTAPAGNPPAATTQHRAARAHVQPGQFIEGRIAFLRTELKITPEQQPLFDKLADEMRAQAKAMQAHRAERKARVQQNQGQQAQAATALEKMERRNAMLKEVSAASDRFLASFKPLYAALSPEQQKTADLLFARNPFGGHMSKMRRH
ncbi:MAG TPA: Spy/CpxP family protein refolding chaperone [Ferrovibrio sp.]|uniref:Spy/CpxP family protein refolding chaperone n=1 Tax=Ferrovibrio sp. TaxID=1917215 RepID=UPI002ED57803